MAYVEDYWNSARWLYSAGSQEQYPRVSPINSVDKQGSLHNIAFYELCLCVVCLWQHYISMWTTGLGHYSSPCCQPFNYVVWALFCYTGCGPRFLIVNRNRDLRISCSGHFRKHRRWTSSKMGVFRDIRFGWLFLYSPSSYTIRWVFGSPKISLDMTNAFQDNITWNSLLDETTVWMHKRFWVVERRSLPYDKQKVIFMWRAKPPVR
jgi:hypothetical protein